MNRNQFITMLWVTTVYILFISCSSPSVVEEQPSTWGSIVLQLGSTQKIIINRSSDSVTFKSWELVPSKEEQEPGTYVRVPGNIQTTVFTLKASERDSVYKWSRHLIENPAVPEYFCSDYVGRLAIQISYGSQFVQYGEYSSLCKWYNIKGLETKKLRLLLKSKVNEIY